MPYFNSKLLYTPLLLTAFVCAIVNSKFLMHNSRWLLYALLQLKMLLQQYCNRQLFIHYYDYWLLYALLQLTNLVCAIVIDNFCMHYCNWQLLYAIKQLWNILCLNPIPRGLKYNLSYIIMAIDFCMHYCNWQQFYALLKLTTVVCYIATLEYSMLQKEQHYSLYPTC